MLLSNDELQEQVRDYWKIPNNPERMGQWLLNRMPLKLNDPDLFYEEDSGIAVHKYQERYVVSSEAETRAWIEAKKAEGVLQVNLQEVKDSIQQVEFNTSGSDGSCYTTTCTLTTNFGFKAMGKGDAIHEDGYCEGVGKRFALQRAFSNLVEHHSYLVRYNMHQAGLTSVQPKKPKG